ncbi:MAG: hypothetical protein NHB14_04440 [Desulfosporosinus sp.]|nr:hypothetical protein [Desulfosporosinus sp.]
MIDHDILNKKCPKCSGLGRTVNPAWNPLWNMCNDLKVSFQILKSNEELAEPRFYVCEECNGTGQLLPEEVKELLEYILS